MLLDRIDIDNHGPLNRVELGPFSEYLNVVCAPEGSGKTAIARFIRDSLIRREYPLGMMSSSAGRVVWADQNGKIHCRREHDGTATGRRTIEFETRGETSHRFDWLHGSWINGIADSTDASRALESIRIPESIVDGIVTDTAVTNVSRVIASCLASGLCDPAIFAGLPLNRSTVSGLSPAQTDQDEAQRRALRDELARVEAELANMKNHAVVDPHRNDTEAKRYQLRLRLAQLQQMQRESTHHDIAAPHVSVVDPRVTAELNQLHDRIWQLRVRHSELSRWLSHLEADRNRVRYSSPLTASPYANSSLDLHATSPFNSGLLGNTRLAGNTAPGLSASQLHLDTQLHRRLTEIDGQIIRWRQVLAELHSLRQAIAVETQRNHAHWAAGLSHSLPLTEQFLRQQRMNHFLHSLDHASTSWPDEIDLRIEAIVRQIDGLAARYDRAENLDSRWYQDINRSVGYGNEASLVRSLRAIREDLQNVRRQGFQFNDAREAARRDSHFRDLSQTEQWVTAAITRLLSYRESFVRDRQVAEMVRYPSWLDESYHRQTWSPWYIDHINQESAARTRELNEVSAELDHCNAQADTLRRQMRVLPVVDTRLPENRYASLNAAHYSNNSPIISPSASIAAEIHAIASELSALDLAHPGMAISPVGISHVDSSRSAWLQNRRSELIRELGVPHQMTPTVMPLADEASQWLVRLSGGRLRRLDWPSHAVSSQPTVQPIARIDGRDEPSCPAVDRALAALSLRLAAGDLLARTGRTIPLVIEAHRELLIADQAFAVIAALDDYAKNGRQVVVLASDRVFAEQVVRRGGLTFTIHSNPVEHQHRPLWRPHFQGEAYVGPYDQMNHGNVAFNQHPGDALDRTDAFVNQYHDTFDSVASSANASIADINRNLDTIWQDAYGAPNHQWNDGYYFANSYTTAPPAPPRPEATANAARYGVGASPRASENLNENSISSGPTTNGSPPRRPSPFFLTVDSPIDQAPSIDAVAASRMRGLKVTHVNHLMNQDPNRLSDSLGLAGVTAATIRRWQSECRLVCQVPQLRGFDARVLVGCGITDAAHLAATDPNDLLDRVEAFLATERGQRILLSGTSYELSRITSWIAAANHGTDEPLAMGMRDRQTVDGRVIRGTAESRSIGVDTFDRDRYEYEFVDDDGNVVRASSGRSRTGRRRGSRTSRNGSAGSRTYGIAKNGQSQTGHSTGNGTRSRSANGSSDANGSGNGQASRRGTRNGSGRGNTAGRASRSSGRRSTGREAADFDSTPLEYEYDREPRSGYDFERRSRSTERTHRHEHDSSDRKRAPRESRGERSYGERESHQSRDSELELRFYLERESPVVDAPSIGNRMAAKLEALGIMTVNDLLESDPATVAEQLDHRRIDADTIIAWQNQAILVCRIPMLRGHDAQLLVAAEVTTPEEVAEYEPDDLFALIDPIARSNEGKRIIRGGKLPDLEEISEWISYAAQSRELMAA